MSFVETHRPYTTNDPPPDYWAVIENDTGLGFSYELVHFIETSTGRIEESDRRPWVAKATGKPVCTRQPYLRGAMNHFVRSELDRSDLFLHPLTGTFMDFGDYMSKKATERQEKEARQLKRRKRIPG